MNLAYYEYSAGNPVLGLKYMKYALSQWRLLDTATHPDTASIYVSFLIYILTLQNSPILVPCFKNWTSMI